MDLSLSQQPSTSEANLLFCLFMGTDIYRLPSNMKMVRGDFESPWDEIGLIGNSWDLIHMRMLNGSVKSWPELYQKVFE